MLKLTAVIIWKTPESGGLKNKPFSGIKPSFSVAGELITSQVFGMGMEEGETMPVGKECLAEIRLPYGEVYQDSADN